ncbi:MAG: electron transfer flavoprotein subunit alpha/FixB family protein [candidate division WOR-3 bacterium]
MSGVMVLAEHRQGVLRDVTLEMLTAARALGRPVDVVILGDRVDPMVEQLKSQADRILYGSNPAFREFNYELYQHALVRLVAEQKPDLLLVAHSAFGTDLGPSLAVALGAPLVSDATALAWTDNGILVSRGMYSGKLVADWLIPSSPAVVMVRQSNFKPEPASKTAEVIRWDPGDVTAGAKTKFITIEEVPTTGIDITKASIIIGVGRGIKEEKNLPLVKELAEDLGAVLAASRPVVDAGWLPKEVQVGSSGKTVKPKLYISGAFQHVAGMKAAETIIAVNKDPKAPIFAVAHYGIVDDLLKVVPVLRQKVKEMKS